MARGRCTARPCPPTSTRMPIGAEFAAKKAVASAARRCHCDGTYRRRDLVTSSHFQNSPPPAARRPRS